MENMEFDVVFKGEIAKGFKMVDVKNNLASAFKLPPDKLERLFTGRSVPLKKSISSDRATALQQSLLKMGAVSHVTPTHIERHIENKVIKNKLVLSLEPIAQQALNNPTRNIDEDTEDHVEEKGLFEFPRINPIAIFLLLVGIPLLVLFSPYPDYVFRKGFLLGLVFVFFGIRNLKS